MSIEDEPVQPKGGKTKIRIIAGIIFIVMIVVMLIVVNSLSPTTTDKVLSQDEFFEMELYEDIEGWCFINHIAYYPEGYVNSNGDILESSFSAFSISETPIYDKSDIEIANMTIDKIVILSYADGNFNGKVYPNQYVYIYGYVEYASVPDLNVIWIDQMYDEDSNLIEPDSQ